MDRSAEVVRQDHIQEAMRVKVMLCYLMWFTGGLDFRSRRMWKYWRVFVLAQASLCLFRNLADRSAPSWVFHYCEGVSFDKCASDNLMAESHLNLSQTLRLLGPLWSLAQFVDCWFNGILVNLTRAQTLKFRGFSRVAVPITSIVIGWSRAKGVWMDPIALIQSVPALPVLCYCCHSTAVNELKQKRDACRLSVMKFPT